MHKDNLEDSARSSVSSSESKSEEQKLIESAQNGNKAAFGKLIRMHQKRLFRFVYGLVNSFDMTEDLVQETFVKAFEKIETFKTGYAFYPWIATIARNRAFNLIQREEKKESLDKLTEVGFAPQSNELGALDKLLDDENKKRLYKAIAALPVKYRTVFTMRHFEKMDYAEIASYLKIPPGTVDSRLHRARQMLLDAVKDLL